MKCLHGGTAGIAIAFLALAGGGPAVADEYGPLKVVETSLGELLADAKGMTVYTFDKDEAGKSNCDGQCAVNWPPVLASATDKPMGDLTIIKRADGSLQWANEGRPLYTYISDMKPGDATGDNKGGVWHVVVEE